MSFACSQRMRIRGMALALLIACGCSKTPPPPAAAGNPVLAPPEPQKLLAVRVQRFDIAPGTVQKGQPVNVTIRLEDLPPATAVTLAWFGPDGWLVADETKEASGSAVSFTASPDRFRQPGRYRAELRSGNVYLGEGSVTVNG